MLFVCATILLLQVHPLPHPQQLLCDGNVTHLLQSQHQMHHQLFISSLTWISVASSALDTSNTHSWQTLSSTHTTTHHLLFCHCTLPTHYTLKIHSWCKKTLCSWFVHCFIWFTHCIVLLQSWFDTFVSVLVWLLCHQSVLVLMPQGPQLTSDRCVHDWHQWQCQCPTKFQCQASMDLKKISVKPSQTHCPWTWKAHPTFVKNVLQLMSVPLDSCHVEFCFHICAQ